MKESSLVTCVCSATGLVGYFFGAGAGSGIHSLVVAGNMVALVFIVVLVAALGRLHGSRPTKYQEPRATVAYRHQEPRARVPTDYYDSIIPTHHSRRTKVARYK